MTTKLQRLTLHELVTLFREYALQQESVLLDSNTAAYNGPYDKIEAIADELRSRGMEARRSLLALLDDKNLRVRYAAAVRSLAADRERPRRNSGDCRISQDAKGGRGRDDAFLS